ncbi:MAG: hypothetical protein DRJ98_03215 [Thermoprotei archaeon]|nr:MAG: hypothetical protein DRJ98_03215 [Thermoprotei archaeon]RLF18907.1 MAG: hypothetical protein DRN06_00180 [Thermoprotei archaeon]
MLTFEDGYEAAKMMAERFDLARLKEAAEAIGEALKVYQVEEHKDFLLGLQEGLSELARFKEEVIRLQNMAKAMGVLLEVNVKFRE